MGEPTDDADPSDGSYDSEETGSSGSESESDTFSPQQPAQVKFCTIGPAAEHCCSAGAAVLAAIKTGYRCIDGHMGMHPTKLSWARSGALPLQQSESCAPCAPVE